MTAIVQIGVIADYTTVDVAVLCSDVRYEEKTEARFRSVKRLRESPEETEVV